MATVVELVGLFVLLFVNTAIAALGTRFFRVRLHTRWGSALYTLLLVPIALFVLTLVFGGVLRLGPDLGTPAAVVAITIVLPMAIGVSFDYFWMPAPAEVDLPEARDGDRRRSPQSRRD